MTEQYIENRNNTKKEYDLEERTALFGEAVGWLAYKTLDLKAISLFFRQQI